LRATTQSGPFRNKSAICWTGIALETRVDDFTEAKPQLTAADLQKPQDARSKSQRQGIANY